MISNVRIEEITALGDFILTSYYRDFDAIKAKFPKLDDAFKDKFVTKLEFVKGLESTLMLSEQHKGVTESLYKEAAKLNDELNFLSSYFKDAGLNNGLVSSLKRDLHDGNIEGAILKIEGIRQFTETHKATLTAEGMPDTYTDLLTDYKTNLIEKNKMQNDLMNARKQLTDANHVHYDELLSMIKQIVSKGKLIFKGTVYQDEYTTTKVVQRMRAAKRKSEEGIS